RNCHGWPIRDGRVESGTFGQRKRYDVSMYIDAAATATRHGNSGSETNKVKHESIEFVRLFPLSPMPALAEYVQPRIGYTVDQPQASVQCQETIISAPGT